MKKSILFSGLFLPLFLNAQSYTIEPSNSLTEEVSVTGFSGVQISLRNQINKTIDFEWELLEDNLVSGWDYSLCSFGFCYPGVPGSGNMEPVAPGDSGFLKMNVLPQEIEGSGFIRFLVYEKGTSQKDTLTFFFNTPNAGSTTNLTTNNKENVTLKLFPNPASEVLFIESPFISSTLSVFNSQGRLVSKDAIAGHNFNYNLNSLAPGNYIALVEDGSGRSSFKKFIIK